MPHFSDLKPDLMAADVGLLWLLVMVVLCSAIVWFLVHRIPRWQKPFSVVSQLSIVLLSIGLPSGVMGASWLLLFSQRWLAWLRVTLRSRWALAWIVLIALAVRLPRMNESLWYDEAFSVQLASLPLDRFGEAVLADVHPPIYYLVLRAFRAVFGESPVAMRLPSLIVGLLSLLVMVRIGTRLGSRDIGRMAALLMALSPGAAYYSIEARSYALLTLEVFLALLCLLERRRWSFAAAVIAMCWTHNFGFLYAAWFGTALLGLALVRGSSHRRGFYALAMWSSALAVAALGAATWLPFMAHEAQTVSDGYWMYFSPAAIVVPFVSMIVGTVSSDLVGLVVIGWMMVLCASVAAAWRHLNRAYFWLLTVMILGVPLLATVISGLWQPVFLARALLPAMQLLFVPVAILVLKQPARVFWMRLMAVVLLASLVPFFTYKGRPDYRTLLFEHCGQYGDPLYHTSLTSAFVAAQAYPRELPQLDWELATDQGDTFDAGASAVFGFKSGTIEALAGYGTVCIVQTRTPLSKVEELAHLEQVLARYPHTTAAVQIEPYFQLIFYRVEVG